MAAIKAGDLVWLKSGGRKMTAEYVGEENRVDCVWFDGAKIERSTIIADALTTNDPAVVHDDE